MDTVIPTRIEAYLRLALIPIAHPGLPVNRDDGLWHCFRCSGGRDVQKPPEEGQAP
jgi:hypothetical protein